MTYQEVEDFLFNQLPIYQKQGIDALNRSLDKTKKLLEHLGNPQNNFKSVLVGGTNGKGSSCHMIASVLQESGYKTGLHTSPHLKSYTERVRINGVEIEKEYIISFIGDNIDFFKEQLPSFFEITVALAFKCFSDCKVDIAIIEVGMGGRFDSTNVLKPLVCLITNIGLDHQHILGNTLEKIAGEKAGIIKKGIPVVIGTTQKETTKVFKNKAEEVETEILFSDVKCKDNEWFTLDLKGNYQKRNLPGILSVFDELARVGFSISNHDIDKGLSYVVKNTNLKGRWQVLSLKPLIICDTAHNVDGLMEVVKQVKEQEHEKLHIVFGMVNDKSSREILELLPKEAHYYFVEPNIPRAKPVTELFNEAIDIGLTGEIFKNVNEAIQIAKNKASKRDMIYIGGSTFVVAEIDDL